MCTPFIKGKNCHQTTTGSCIGIGCTEFIKGKNCHQTTNKQERNFIHPYFVSSKQLYLLIH
jgi:hypothetical protein